MSLEKWTAPYVDIQNSYLNIFIFIFIFTSLYLLTFYFATIYEFVQNKPSISLECYFFIFALYILTLKIKIKTKIFMNKKNLTIISILLTLNTLVHFKSIEYLIGSD